MPASPMRSTICESAVAVQKRTAPAAWVDGRWVEVPVGDRVVIQEYGLHARYNGSLVMKVSAVKSLIAANVVVFLLQGASSGHDGGRCSLCGRCSPSTVESYFHVWQIVTYAFLHDPRNISHICVQHARAVDVRRRNRALRRAAAPARVLLRLGGDRGAERSSSCRRLLGAPPAPTIGASGGVFGLLLAYALMFPHRKVIPLIPPIPMPAWLFATLYAGIELLFWESPGSLSGIAHFAHLGGMIGSALVVMQWRRERARR